MTTQERFGPYVLRRLIGRGGMGEVHEAYDTEQERLVALKRLAPHLTADPASREQFRAESRLTARLRDPHVIPIHRYGEIDGQLFLEMRLVCGTDLADVLEREGRLDPERAVRLVEQVAGAVDAAHRDGLVHRDVKPSNVLLCGSGAAEFAYLVDFGISHVLADRAAEVIGTLDYMSPEQFDGVVVPAGDVYALGCVLYQCLAGSVPFPRAGTVPLAVAHRTAPPPAVSRCRPDLAAFDDVVATALHKDPARRYATAGDLAAAARHALTAPPVRPTTVPAPSPGPVTAGSNWVPLPKARHVRPAPAYSPVAGRPPAA